MNEKSTDATRWILRTSVASPFGRKVRMALAAIDKLSDTTIELADTNDPADTLRQQNPLGKIPILLTGHAPPLFDSRVIVDYIDDADGRHILLSEGIDRYTVLRQQALADGLMDAALLQIYEVRARPEEKRHDAWLAYQHAKVERALTAFSEAPPSLTAALPHIGAIALAAALGYLDFRFEGDWRPTYPDLVRWLEAFASSFDAFAATRPG